MQKEWKYRWAPTLGRLESTAEEVWGIEKYNPETDQDNPVVFFGVYGLPDFYALWRHKGRKAILWAGTDILHFSNGYWLDDTGDIRLRAEPLAEWINKNCESWTENVAEHDLLDWFGIESTVCPSFLGNIDDFEVSYKYNERPKVYASVSGNNFKQYGWNKIPEIARQNPDIEFHLYGSSDWKSNLPNIFVHGRVPKEQMNAEIKEMQGGLRPLEFDGFSEILAKSVLWGQWPVSFIHYEHMLPLSEIGTLKDKKEPNLAGREYYRNLVNSYPWNNKK